MPRTFFTVNVGSQPRALFSAELRRNGDLTLIVRHGINWAKPRSAYVVDGAHHRIVEQHISVHRSPSSRDTNVLHSTMVLANGQRLSTRNHTRAIKKGPAYAPIFLQRCADQTPDRYLLRYTKTPMISLCYFDPFFFQLIFQVWVGETRT